MKHSSTVLCILLPLFSPFASSKPIAGLDVCSVIPQVNGAVLLVRNLPKSIVTGQGYAIEATVPTYAALRFFPAGRKFQSDIDNKVQEAGNYLKTTNQPGIANVRDQARQLGTKVDAASRGALDSVRQSSQYLSPEVAEVQGLMKFALQSANGLCAAVSGCNLTGEIGRMCGIKVKSAVAPKAKTKEDAKKYAEELANIVNQSLTLANKEVKDANSNVASSGSRSSRAS